MNFRKNERGGTGKGPFLFPFLGSNCDRFKGGYASFYPTTFYAVHFTHPKLPPSHYFLPLPHAHTHTHTHTHPVCFKDLAGWGDCGGYFLFLKSLWYENWPGKKRGPPQYILENGI